MGGDLPGTNMNILVNDNFHDGETRPAHLPEISNECAVDSVDCVLQSTTISWNIYADYDKLDTGYHP